MLVRLFVLNISSFFRLREIEATLVVMKETISLWIKSEEECETQPPLYFDWKHKQRMMRGSADFYGDIDYVHHHHQQQQQRTDATRDLEREDDIVTPRYSNSVSKLSREMIERFSYQQQGNERIEYSRPPSHSTDKCERPVHFPHRMSVITSKPEIQRNSVSPENSRTSLSPEPPSSIGSSPPRRHHQVPLKSWEENIDELRLKLAANFQELRQSTTMNIQRLHDNFYPTGSTSTSPSASSRSCSSRSSCDSDSEGEIPHLLRPIANTFGVLRNSETDASLDDGCKEFPEEHHNLQASADEQLTTAASPRAKGQIKEKTFKCTLCPKAFTQKCNLTKHIRVHTNEKPYKCDYCDKAFTQKAYLVPHRRTHTHEKPFQCEHCGKSFTQKHDLTKHVRIHTNVRPYACTLCDKAFVQKSALTSHIRTHTKERPFACTFCSKAFNQKYDLTKHIRTHTKEKRFTCDSCSKSFSRKDYFNIHLKLCTKNVLS